MSKARGVLLLAWWFLSSSYHYSATTVGPFRDQAECEQMRAWLYEKTPSKPLSWCWWDGKP